MSGSDIALKYVVPAVGVAVANVMFSSPMLAVLKVRREKSLGVRLEQTNARTQHRLLPPLITV